MAEGFLGNLAEVGRDVRVALRAKLVDRESAQGNCHLASIAHESSSVC